MAHMAHMAQAWRLLLCMIAAGLLLGLDVRASGAFVVHFCVRAGIAHIPGKPMSGACFTDRSLSL